MYYEEREIERAIEQATAATRKDLIASAAAIDYLRWWSAGGDAYPYIYPHVEFGFSGANSELIG